MPKKHRQVVPAGAADGSGGGGGDGGGGGGGAGARAHAAGGAVAITVGSTDAAARSGGSASSRPPPPQRAASPGRSGTKKASLKKMISRSQSARVGELANRAAVLEAAEQEATTGLAVQRTSSGTLKGGFMLHIDGLFIVVWGAVLLLFIVYITFMTPLSVAMDLGDVSVENPWTVLASIDFVIDIIFIIDVVINFFTSFIDKNGVEVTNRKQIKVHYLKTWFTVDFLSSIPFSVIQIAAVYAQQASLATVTDPQEISSVLRASRVIRVVKMARLVKCIRIITKSATIEMSKNQRRLLRDLGILVVLLHFVACTYISVAFAGGVEDSLHGSWVQTYIPDVGTLQGSELNLELYVSALYWAVATLTTVGFGDVVPVNTAERVVAIVAMLVSAAYYGYLIASMASGVSAWDANAAKMNERMEQLTAYTKAKRFPRKLRRKIETYYQSYYKERTAVNELEVLRGLSVGLRREVTEFMLDDAKGELLSNMLVFRGLDRSVLAKLFLAMSPQYFSAGECIMEAGHAERNLFILLSGDVVIDTPHLPERPDTHLKVGASFGELQFLGLRPVSVLTVRAAADCKVWAISRKDFHDMLDETDDTLTLIVSTAMAIYEQFFEQFAADCMLDIDSRLSKYIAEVARFDIIEEQKYLAQEAVEALSLLRSPHGSSDASCESSDARTAGGAADAPGAPLLDPTNDGSSTGTPPLQIRKAPTATTPLVLRGRSNSGSFFSHEGQAPASAAWQDVPDTDLLTKISEFKTTFDERIQALNEALDNIGAPPASRDTVVALAAQVGDI